MNVIYLNRLILASLVFVLGLALSPIISVSTAHASHVFEFEDIYEDEIPAEFIIPELVNFEKCIATILNRSTQLNPDGTFMIPNIPVSVGTVRVRIVCEPAAGIRKGQSEFVIGVPNGMTQFGEISFTEQEPIPVSLEISSPATVLTPTANGAQLVTTGILADGTQIDLTLADTGTFYLASNSAIATVSADGFVNAVSSGRVLITGTHEGVIATIALTVELTTDSDGDGLPNDFELANGLDPNFPDDATQDPDGDGLTNLQEFNAGTDLFLADTDGDGLSDAQELALGSNPVLGDTDNDGLLDGNESNPTADPDGDGLINILDPDSDNDGLPDGVEVALVSNPFGAQPFEDNDGDLLNNLDEVQLFTDPANPDTDGDGLTDGEEVLAGTDPLVSDSTPPVVNITSPVGGDTLIEGQTITVKVDATDDGRVVSVDLLVDGNLIKSDTTDPFAFAFKVPVGVTSLTFGATAVDTNNNVGTAPGVSVSVIPDPLTTVIGFVVDVDNLPVDGVTLITNGDVPGITLADGSFEIPNVPTVVGDVVVRASKTIAGENLLGTSAALPPVLGGITDVGVIAVTNPPLSLLYGAAFKGPDGLATLYVIDTRNGNATEIGPIGFERVSSLHFDPSTETIFATGERSDGSDTHVLLTIDPGSAAGTDIGPTGVASLAGPFQFSFNTASDISLRNADGVMFGYTFPGDGLVTIDLASGAMTQIGINSGVGILGNAIAFSDDDTLFKADEDGLSILDTTATSGAATFVTSLTFNNLPGFPFSPRANAMDFHPETGELYASVINDFSSFRENFLATIDTASGDTTILGPTVTGLDGLAWVTLPDSDGDGLFDVRETVLGTDPSDADSDDDGLLDGFEITNGFDPLTPGEEAGDPDADGLDNLGEQASGSDPHNPDTDGDGILDGQEVSP